MFRAGDFPVRLLPRHAGWYENYLIQVELGGNFTCRDEVTVVDGIKSTAHYAEA
ncbi:hypothetical protein GCM10027417_07330 [Glutamicibacter endophyticus]